MIERQRLAELFRSTRLQRGLRQQDVALRVGCNPTYIHQLETGKLKGSFDTLTRMANALDLPVEMVLLTAGFELRSSREPKALITDVVTWRFSQLDEKMKSLLLQLEPVLALYVKGEK